MVECPGQPVTSDCQGGLHTLLLGQGMSRSALELKGANCTLRQPQCSSMRDLTEHVFRLEVWLQQLAPYIPLVAARFILRAASPIC